MIHFCAKTPIDDDRYTTTLLLKDDVCMYHRKYTNLFNYDKYLFLILVVFVIFFYIRKKDKMREKRKRNYYSSYQFI
jgi:hypothetical protein